MTLDLDKSAWKRVRLGDVVRRSRKQVDPIEAGVERYVGGQHIDGDSITIDRWGDPNDGQMGSTFRYVFEPGQILFLSARPYLRKSGVVDFSGVVADKTYVLDAAPENGLLQEFLPFVLASDPFIAYATAEATGSMNPRLLWGQFQRYEFDLPPLDEQQRLADILWAIEHHGRSMRETADALSVASDIRLGEVLDESGWPRRKVPDLLLAGPTNGKSAPSNDEGRGVPTLSISAVREGEIRGGSAVKYMDVEPSEIAAFKIEERDFFVVRGNGNKMLTGRGGLAVGGLPAGCVYPDLLIRLRFDPMVMLPEFAAVQWNSINAHRELIQKAKSTNGIWKINGKDIKAHILVVPPIVDQEVLLDEARVSRSALKAVNTERGGLREMRHVLMREVFGGVA